MRNHLRQSNPLWILSFFYLRWEGIQASILLTLTVADPGFGQGGGPNSGQPNFADIAKQVFVGMGSGACLRAPEAYGVFMAKYAFS